MWDGLLRARISLNVCYLYANLWRSRLAFFFFSYIRSWNITSYVLDNCKSKSWDLKVRYHSYEGESALSKINMYYFDSV